ncbi:HEPN domain-containing protein [Candidatus Pacearchaeota archaeon]|nr:HEPN domain-containing protein [Candidatus Pacearchaeota archaeon]
MSEAKRKVEWCLRKAEEELKKGTKHRGLVLKEQNLSEARKHIQKAEHNLKAIEYFSNGGFSDWSMSAVFYCIYHCFLAINMKFGYESRNQECTIALVKHLKEENKINLDDRFIDALEIYDESERHETNVIEKREYYTYGTTVSADNKEEIEASIVLCKDCIAQTKNIVFQDN